MVWGKQLAWWLTGGIVIVWWERWTGGWQVVWWQVLEADGLMGLWWMGYSWWCSNPVVDGRRWGGGVMDDRWYGDRVVIMWCQAAGVLVVW